MQLGHGDDDYSAVARKYSPHVQPVGGEEAGLELFEQPAVPEPFPGVELHGEILEPVQPDNFVSMMPEIGGQEPETTNDAIAPGPEIIQPAPVSEESTPAPSSEDSTPQEESSTALQEENSTAPQEESSTPA